MRPLLRNAVVTLLIVGLVLGAALLLARQQRFEWTTDSRAALEAFEAGQEAAGKLYAEDAVESYEQALEADPEFAAAQLYLLFALSRHKGEPQRMKELVDALERHDLEELTLRERTLLRVFRSRAAGEADRGVDIMEEYLEEHPDDPWVLDLYCMSLVTSGAERQAAAEDCLAHLIEVDPNRVQAQNLLAYIAMNRGDFALAEERFEIYRYLAPDQANPHDSLGELLMVTGRYGRAREELRAAVSLKPDFCPSWRNLVLLGLLEREPARARGVVAEMGEAGGCPPSEVDAQQCHVRLWQEALERRWEQVWELSRPSAGLCPAGMPEAEHFAVRAAAETGRLEEARQIRDRVSDREPGPGEPYSVRDFLALHMSGVIADAEGDREAAAERLGHVDGAMPWGGGLGVVKLQNRLQLAAVLAAAGEQEEARAVRAALARVNRPFATEPPVPPLHPLPPLPPPSPTDSPTPAPAPRAP